MLCCRGVITPSPDDPMIPFEAHCDASTQTQIITVRGGSVVGKTTGGGVVVVVVVVVVGVGVVLVVGFIVVVVALVVVGGAAVVAFTSRQHTSKSPVHLRYLVQIRHLYLVIPITIHPNE